MTHKKKSNFGQGGANEEKEARRLLYAFKIMDFLWFEGKLPKNLEKPFQFFTNEYWPPVEKPIPFDKLMEFDESDLEYICDRLIRPDWIYLPKCPSGDMTMREASDFTKAVITERNISKPISNR